MNILKTVTLPILAGATFLSSASPTDVRTHYEGEKVLQQHQPSMYQVDGVNAAKAESIPNVELVVFYQPSYASSFGEYNVYNRSVEFVNTMNEALATHGLVNYKINIKDIVPVVSVPDGAPYVEYDESGNATQGGAESLFSLAALNEHILVNGELEKSPEYEIYQIKWKADLVLYLREQRAGDPHLGLASIGGDYASAVDIGGDAHLYTTIAHEIGHNFGMDHEEVKANTAVEYARAWECNNKQTIMYSSSAQSSTLRHFSDPNIINGGVACGDESKAYNAKVLADNFVATTQRRAGVESLGTVSFKETAYSGNESAGVTMSLVRDGDISEQASVKVFAENGDALWGEDFTESFVLAEFAEGEAETSVVFPFVNDGAVEGVETLKAHIKFPYKLSLGAKQEAQLSVLDGESFGAGGVVSISGPSTLEEGQEITLTVTRAGGVGEIIVNVATPSDDAQAGIDYIPLNTNLVFKEGEFEKQVTMTTPVNNVAEVDSEVLVTISSPNSGVSYDSNTHKVALLDDDAQGAGVFDLVEGQSLVSENAGTYPLTIKRSGGFAATSVTVTSTIKNIDTVVEVPFAKNEIEITVQISFPDNNTEEADYEMAINLTTTDVGATVNNSTLTVTINDNDKATSNSEGSGGGSFGFISLLAFAGLVFRRKAKSL